MIESILTLNPVKKIVYRHDSAFTGAIGAVLDLWCDPHLMASFLWNHSAIVLRPEAIVAHQSRSIFPMLRACGLVPVCIRRIHMTPIQGGLMWRYQTNVMTPGHYLLLQRLLSIAPSIYLILRDQSERRSAPAAGHITYLKGPTLTAKRRPLHLRSLAGPAIANILSYIHASDDPADFLRELAILFPKTALVEILREAAAGQDRTDEALAAIVQAELYAPKGILVPDDNSRGHGSANLSPPEDLALRRDWIALIKHAQDIKNYVSGEAYDTRAATIPDDKKYLARLDDNLIFADISPGF
jgi:hypothetical protein